MSESLSCPICQQPLYKQDSQYRCDQNHSFDIAKQGYSNLLPVQFKRSKSPGDSKEMVQARQQFLQLGHYQNISDKLNQLIVSSDDGQNTAVTDAGCGEGYYLSRLKQAQPNLKAIGLDISKFAVQVAAKRTNHIEWIVASNKQPPIQANSQDWILCLFGFAVYPAFFDCLKPGGKLIMLDAGEQHLVELKQQLYPELKPFKGKDFTPAFNSGFTLLDTQHWQSQFTVNNAGLNALLAMTPHIHKAPKQALAKLQQADRLNLTLDVECRTFEKTVSAS